MDTTTRSATGGEANRSRPGSPARSRPAGRRDPRRPAAGPRGPQPGPRYRPAAVARAVRPGPHHWFAERLLAVVTGHRPVHSLLGHTVGPAYQQLVTLTSTAPPPRAPGRADPGRERPRPAVHRCGRFTPGPGVIEAFARITTGDRVTAMAFRLEQGPDLRWRCAAVELHGPRP
ncbi:Rv3235 family protein [Streptomyces sp. NPDC051567]|uniref:Rv3235 family protein n=1 Tax=Streptomyces sp. NPDC051567 TaxID=3365660 RepID=UPI00379F92C0